MEIARASRRALLRERFNGAMLAAAREARFLSQTQLAELLGVSKALVGKWEADLSVPSDEQLPSLASELDVRAELFFVDRSRRLASMSDFYHRALSRAKRRDVKAIHARCSILDIQIDRLLNAIDLSDDTIPDIDPTDHNNNIEKIAGIARNEMGIGHGPIRNLTEEIEKCGAIVIDRYLEVDEVDALCRWVPELPKLFFLNGSKPPDRIRFSLAHELGHTVLHFKRDYDLDVAEKQANAFASAFLMPSEDIRKDFQGGVRIGDLAAIKRKWRVSMQAAARRARDIGVIDDRRYRSLYVQMSRKGWRKTEPVSISGESPTTLSRLLKQHLDMGFSINDLAALLLVPEKVAARMVADIDLPNFQDDGVRLRIVRDDD